MIFQYPLTGFHFSVAFELFPQTPNDFRFQEVSGLAINVETEEIAEGGENRFKHKLPKRTNYSELELKRGMFMGSGIINWCLSAIENFEFRPTNITISLLNEQHIPISAWYVVNAYPIQWSITSLDAKKNEVVVETLKIQYNYFKMLSLSAIGI